PRAGTAAEVAVRRQRRVRRAEGLRNGAGEQEALGLEVQQSERRLQQRAVHALAAAGAVAQPQGAEHAERAQDARRQIEERDAAADGCAAGLAGDRHDAAERLHERLVAGALGARARAAEGRDGAVDEPRVFPRQRLVAEAELLHRPRAEVLDQDVGRRGEAPHEGDAVRLLEIDGDAALVAVVDEVAGGLAVLVRGPRARFVTDARVLDLDHVGAEVSEQRAAVGAGQHAREVHDTDTIEGQRRRGGLSAHVRYYTQYDAPRRRPRPAHPGARRRDGDDDPGRRPRR